MDRRARYRDLSPALTSRIADLTRPRWARTVLARRLLAGVLVVVAVCLYFRGDPDTDRVSAVVAGHDLQPGKILTADDLRSVTREAGSLPHGAVRNVDDIVGRTLAGATRAGDTITDVRVLGPRLAAASTGSADSRIVPIRLADAGVAELLRQGDRVDVLTTSDSERDSPSGNDVTAAVLAIDAAVVLVSATESARGSKDRVVMLALPTDAAAKVAATSLSSALTVIFH